MLTTQQGALPFVREVREREKVGGGKGGGGKEDYEGPTMRGPLFEPEKVCGKRSTHSGHELEPS